MKGLAIRLILGIALLLWAWDMVYPWQKIMQREDNQYSRVLQEKQLTVGMINHPLSYFVGREGNAGIEYELASAFADYLGVSLAVKTYDHSEQLFDALRNNDIDLAAAGLVYQPQHSQEFQLGASYYSSQLQVVYQKGTQRPYQVSELMDELLVPTGANIVPLLEALQKTQPNLKWQTSDKFTQEELLIQVAEGKIPYTAALSVDVRAAQHINPNLAVAFDLTDKLPVLWYLPNSSYSELQAALLGFMDEAQKSSLIARIEEKYFNHLDNFNYVDIQSFHRAIENTLPKYQPLFEKYKGSLDWQTLAAIAYQESHWNPNAVSPTGVRGMMMLTRDTAERMNVTNRTDPEQSVKAGSDYLHLLISQLPTTIADEDKIWFALAAYNMGMGHLIDIRRLTKDLGGNPDDWLEVKKNLPLLAEKRYYQRLKYGYARGFEAFQYVENIRRYLNSLLNYQRVKAQANTLEQEELTKQESQPQDEATLPQTPTTGAEQ
ncbi:lytic transglycosylase F [Pasteurellaceae bacterium RH1A]|nr:lytic transglycosylase F [Pasteurellaceae bacterium RH1A]